MKGKGDSSRQTLRGEKVNMPVGRPFKSHWIPEGSNRIFQDRLRKKQNTLQIEKTKKHHQFYKAFSRATALTLDSLDLFVHRLRETQSQGQDVDTCIRQWKDSILNEPSACSDSIDDTTEHSSKDAAMCNFADELALERAATLQNIIVDIIERFVVLARDENTDHNDRLMLPSVDECEKELMRQDAPFHLEEVNIPFDMFPGEILDLDETGDEGRSTYQGANPRESL